MDELRTVAFIAHRLPLISMLSACEAPPYCTLTISIALE